MQMSRAAIDYKVEKLQQLLATPSSSLPACEGQPSQSGTSEGTFATACDRRDSKEFQVSPPVPMVMSYRPSESVTRRRHIQGNVAAYYQEDMMKPVIFPSADFAVYLDKEEPQIFYSQNNGRPQSPRDIEWQTRHMEIYNEILNRGPELYSWEDIVEIFSPVMPKDLIEDTIHDLFDGGKLALWHSCNHISGRTRVGLPDHRKLVPPSLYKTQYPHEYLEQTHNVDWEELPESRLYRGFLFSMEDQEELDAHLEWRKGLLDALLLADNQLS
mgnify:CR=1 FL=1